VERIGEFACSSSIDGVAHLSPIDRYD